MPSTTQAPASSSASTPSSMASSASAGNAANNTTSACHADGRHSGGGGSAQPDSQASDGGGEGERRDSRPPSRRVRRASQQPPGSPPAGSRQRRGSQLAPIRSADRACRRGGGSASPRSPARHSGCSRTRSRKTPRVEAQDLAIGLGLDAGGPRIVGEQRHLAERLAGACRTFTRSLAGAALFSHIHAPPIRWRSDRRHRPVRLPEDDLARL